MLLSFVQPSMELIFQCLLLLKFVVAKLVLCTKNLLLHQEKNPLGDDELDKSADNDNVKDTVNEEEALLETVSVATVRPPFVNECVDEPETETPMNDSETVESDNPLGNVDYPVGESGDNDKIHESDPFSDVASGIISKPLEARPPDGQPLTEEDLLTGPAHNLDDSQYKADYVDPNLEDIFK